MSIRERQVTIGREARIDTEFKNSLAHVFRVAVVVRNCQQVNDVRMTLTGMHKTGCLTNGQSIGFHPSVSHVDVVCGQNSMALFLSLT
jgi:hypothetical protein